MRYIDRLAAVNQAAADQMQAYIQRNGFGNTEQIISMAAALADKYGEAAAAATCDMYDAVAAAQGVSVPPAEPARTPSLQEVKDVIEYAIDQAPTTVPAKTGALVKKTSTRTMRKNAARDGAKMALIPSGDGCAFCKMLGSRGWEDARSSKSFEAHLHAHCRCEYVVRFSDNLEVEGYDPDALYEEYLAGGDSSRERMNAMRRTYRSDHKDEINAQKRAAYAAQKEQENSTKARKALVQATLIDREYIYSNAFRDKIDTLTESTTESRHIVEGIRDILAHREGTFYEDLVYVDSNSGKRIINRDYDYYVNGVSACKPNKPMNKMLKEAEPYTIIGIHNHPKSGAPSMGDIMAARDRKYKYGIVVGHDGTLYKYSVSSKFEDEVNGGFYLYKLQKSIYNKDERGAEEAIKLLETLGIRMEVG